MKVTVVIGQFQVLFLEVGCNRFGNDSSGLEHFESLGLFRTANLGCSQIGFPGMGFSKRSFAVLDGRIRKMSREKHE